MRMPRGRCAKSQGYSLVGDEREQCLIKLEVIKNQIIWTLTATLVFMLHNRAMRNSLLLLLLFNYIYFFVSLPNESHLFLMRSTSFFLKIIF